MDQFDGRLEDPASLHKDPVHANNDPINNFDPTGNFTMMQVAIAIDIIGTLASLAMGIYNLFQGNYKEAAAIDFAFVAFWGVAGLRKGLSFFRWWHKARQVRVIYNASIRTIENVDQHHARRGQGRKGDRGGRGAAPQRRQGGRAGADGGGGRREARGAKHREIRQSDRDRRSSRC